jgi:hypothetical protein
MPSPRRPRPCTKASAPPHSGCAPGAGRTSRRALAGPGRPSFQRKAPFTSTLATVRLCTICIQLGVPARPSATCLGQPGRPGCAAGSRFGCGLTGGIWRSRRRIRPCYPKSVSPTAHTWLVPGIQAISNSMLLYPRRRWHRLAGPLAIAVVVRVLDNAGLESTQWPKGVSPGCGERVLA